MSKLGVEDVLGEYETYSAQVADTTATLQDPPMSETLLPMGDLGTHPLAIHRVRVSERADQPAATITSTAHDFVIWGTRRRPWRDYVKIAGDDDYAQHFLDVLNIF